jgi:hypothetical protein
VRDINKQCQPIINDLNDLMHNRGRYYGVDDRGITRYRLVQSLADKAVQYTTLTPPPKYAILQRYLAGYAKYTGLMADMARNDNELGFIEAVNNSADALSKATVEMTK